MPPVFPSLPGQGWSVHKRPIFSTRIAGHVSGREVRQTLYAQTLYEFEVGFDALVSNGTAALAGAGQGSLQTLMGFVLQMQGQLGTFLYVDPTDSLVTNQTIGTGNGVTRSFVLSRSLGGFTEAVSYATSVNAAAVGGAPQAGWTLTAPNTLTFVTAPASGAAVTASFAYAYLCRFLDDAQDFENVMSGLWRMESLKFRSVRTV